MARLRKHSRYQLLASLLATNVEACRRKLDHIIEREREVLDRWHCNDCGGVPHDFMVTEKVWDSAGMPYRGFLCLPCLRKRLGRKLVLADFPDLPINYEIRAVLDD